MSRLESAIRRLQAQAACIDRAASMVRDLPGPVLELGLGNGRTYDHLRDRLPGREIFVFDRVINAHPDCIPDAAHMILGDFDDTLPGIEARIPDKAALIHADIGSGDTIATAELARAMAMRLHSLLQPGGILVCDQALETPGLSPLPLPEGIRPNRYFMYRADRASG
ncbi:MAG: class I SAM-dependent methyltransferase [Sneathiellaceae bacterium]